MMRKTVYFNFKFQYYNLKLTTYNKKFHASNPHNCQTVREKRTMRERNERVDVECLLA